MTRNTNRHDPRIELRRAIEQEDHNADIRKVEWESVREVFEHMEALCDAIIQKQDPQSQWGFNSLLIKRKIEAIRSKAVKE